MIVIGVGNRWRGDDGAGLAVARRVRELRRPGSRCASTRATRPRSSRRGRAPSDVVVVDAAESGAPRRAPCAASTPRAGPLPARSLRSSTHAFGVADAVELARALGRLPRPARRLRDRGRRASRAGDRLSPAVERAVDELAARLGSTSR